MKDINKMKEGNASVLLADGFDIGVASVSGVGYKELCKILAFCKYCCFLPSDIPLDDNSLSPFFSPSTQ